MAVSGFVAKGRLSNVKKKRKIEISVLYHVFLLNKNTCPQKTLGNKPTNTFALQLGICEQNHGGISERCTELISQRACSKLFQSVEHFFITNEKEM